MNNSERIKLDTLIFQSRISNFTTWDELYKIFGNEVLSSPTMEEILLKLSQENINVVEFKDNENVTDSDDYLYSNSEVFKFKDSFKFLRKYEYGNIFCDYLEGSKVMDLSSKYNLSKELIIKHVRTFARELTCPELERRFLYGFIHYDISISQAMSMFHLDMVTIKYLILKASTIKKEELNNITSCDYDITLLLNNFKKRT